MLLKLSGILGPEYVSFPSLGRFSASISSNSFLPLSLFLGLLWWECYHRGLLRYLHVLFSFLLCLCKFHDFVFSSLICSSASYSLLLTLLVYVTLQLLYSSALWRLLATFLYLLSLFKGSHCVVFFSEFSEHLYDHYFELYTKEDYYHHFISHFLRFGLIFCLEFLCLHIFSNSELVFLF